MKLRVPDILLLIVIAVGGVYVWKTGQARSRLESRYARLTSITGDLNIKDPSKLHFQALETDDPMHFAWRIYYPPNYKQVIRSGGFGGTSWRSDPSEFIGRVRFRLAERDTLDCYTHFSGGSSRGSTVNGTLAKFLNDHWAGLKVEQLGSGGLAVVDPAKTVSVLRITIPDDLRARAEKALGTPIPSQFDPAFFDLKIGPDADKP